MDLIAQIWIGICGASSVYLVARRDHWKRWGYIAGMLGQPAWVYTTVVHGQWGIVALTAWYTFSWGMGIWNYWIRSDRPA